MQKQSAHKKLFQMLVLGQSLASVLSDDRMDSISASLSTSAGKYPRVRKFHPGREVLLASAPAR